MNQEDLLDISELDDEEPPPAKRARLVDQRNNGHWNTINGTQESKKHRIGRLDCDMENSVDEDTIFNRKQPVGIDVSCISMTPDTRDKQLVILQSTLTKESINKLSVSDWDRMLVCKTAAKSDAKRNYFDTLSDEVVLNIFRWIPKSCLPDVAAACRRFHRLSNDESLWTRMDVSGKQLQPGVLGQMISRQVIVLRLARSEILFPPIYPGCKASESDFQSRLLYLDLSMAHISTDSLVVLFNKCRRLKKVSLENVPVNDDVLEALSANKEIQVLNLAMCSHIELHGLKELISNCRHITELNIAWVNMDKKCVDFLCSNLPSSMDRLNLSGCRRTLNDQNVADLVSCCPKLRELDLSDCTRLTDDSIRHIVLLEDLTFVALSRCYTIPYKAVLLLKTLPNLIYLNVHGGFIELTDLQQQFASRVEVNKFKFSSVARPTVGGHRSSIWNMRVRD